jgi:hypothetical protein
MSSQRKATSALAVRRSTLRRILLAAAAIAIVAGSFTGVIPRHDADSQWEIPR